MSISYVGTGAVSTILNNGSTYNIAVPAGIASGDVMVMFWALNDQCTANTPAGWTALGGYAMPQTFNGTMYCYYKVASGSEPGTYPVTMVNNGGGRNNNVSIAAFRGVENTTPINVFAVSSIGTSAAPTSPSVTTTVADCALIAFIVEINQHNPTLTEPSGTTAITSGAANATFKNAYTLTTGAAGSYNPGAWASSPSNDFIRMTIALAPASGADTTAPTLTSPTGTQTGSTTASGTVSTDEANGTLYFLASTNASETAATVKAASSQTVTATGAQAVSFTGLTASTTYYAHYCHRDAAGNDSTVASSASFTTGAAASTFISNINKPRSGMGTHFYGAR